MTAPDKSDPVSATYPFSEPNQRSNLPVTRKFHESILFRTPMVSCFFP
jgi:hypothetical protein